VVAPYSLTKSDLRPMGRLEAYGAPRAGGDSTEGGEGSSVAVGPYLGVGVDFLKGELGPMFKAAFGIQISHRNFVLKIVPEAVFSTGSKWDSSGYGGYTMALDSAIEGALGAVWLEGSLRLQGYQDRELGDPEGRTEFEQEQSTRAGVGLSYRPEEGLYLSAQQRAWFLGTASIKSPGLNLSMSKNQTVLNAVVKAGWSWTDKRLTVKWTQVTGIKDQEEFAFVNRGAFDDRISSPQTTEVELAWKF